MNIRLATENDIPQLNQLKQRTDTERYQKRVKDTQEGNAAYLIAAENGEILGHLFLKFYGTPRDPDYPNMEDLFVREDLRGKGLGTKLIKESERIARDKGFNKIGMSVNPTLNPKAKSLYERLGYKDLGRKPRLDGVYDGVEDWCLDMDKEIEW